MEGRATRLGIFASGAVLTITGIVLATLILQGPVSPSLTGANSRGIGLAVILVLLGVVVVIRGFLGPNFGRK